MLLRGWAPIDLIAGPSGYGLPLVRADAFTEDALRADVARPARQRGRRPASSASGRWVRALVRLGLPGRLPARRHPPAHDPPPPQGSTRSTWARPTRSPSRRWRSGPMRRDGRGATREVDLRGRRAGLGLLGRAGGARGGGSSMPRPGTRGPIGVRSGGAWDGEVAYWRSPLSKDDLFRGGLLDLGPDGPATPSASR